MLLNLATLKCARWARSMARGMNHTSTQPKHCRSGLCWTLVRSLTTQRSLPVLWQIISTHHGEAFPTLVILASMAMASMAMVFPVHTADVERVFSTEQAENPPPQQIVQSQTEHNCSHQYIPASCANSFFLLRLCACSHERVVGFQLHSYIVYALNINIQ